MRNDFLRLAMLIASASCQDATKGKTVVFEAASSLTQYVNVFVGTAQNSNPGNVFAGASVPFGMTKVGLQIEGYAPAGYVSESNQPTRGVSPIHDSGTGSSDGSYGNYCIMPVLCDNNDLNLCPVLIEPRHQFRKNNTDFGHPGYFTSTLANGIKIEITSTRRASLERYIFPKSLMEKQKSSPHLVLDWTNDSPGTFRGGAMRADWEKGQVLFNGTWQSSFGPASPRYSVFQCVDLAPPGGKQKLEKHALFGGDRFGMDSKREDLSEWVREAQAYGQPIQAGALVSYSGTNEVLIRRAISFKSAEDACLNAESEIPEWDFADTSQSSTQLWEEKLSRIQLDPSTDDYIRRLFYTSFYRTFLSPNNATLSSPPPYDTAKPYFDGLYCSWDTFRTLFPLMSLASPRDYAQIVETYIEGWRKEGWLPECRANQVKGFIQGGNNGVPILADFAVKYRNHPLDVNLDDLYESIKHDIEVPSPNFSIQGRQAGAYQKYGFVPFAYLDTESTGMQTREASRSLEYSFGDFTTAVTASALQKSKEDVDRYAKSSLNYRLNFDPAAKSEGFTTFVQKRFANGTFVVIDPSFCSPLDKDEKHACSLQQENIFGTYESSSWEYSFYAPHDGAGLVSLLGGPEIFEKRLDHFFDRGYFQAGNEPSFDTSSLYHHVGKPYKSIRRVRKVVAENFGLEKGSLAGNDDNAAMASLAVWFLLGFYPVPGTKEMLVLSPFMPGYTIRNEELGDMEVQVKGFDPRSVESKGEIKQGVRAFVKSLKVDGKLYSSKCRISFDDLFPSAASGEMKGKRVIEIEMTEKEVDGCGEGPKAMPASLSTGGFIP